VFSDPQETGNTLCLLQQWHSGACNMTDCLHCCRSLASHCTASALGNRALHADAASAAPAVLAATGVANSPAVGVAIAVGANTVRQPLRYILVVT
jgi:hypothetical protein